MSQIVIDNAAAISLDRELTIASSTSHNRQLKYFRKGPIQTVAEVQMNVVVRSTYQSLLATISQNILGPYQITFPEEVIGVGVASGDEVTVAVAQSGRVINVTGNTLTTPIRAGSYVQIPGFTQVFTVTSDVVIDGAGNGVIQIDYPLPSTSATGMVNAGTDCTLQMHMIERPRASFGPTGLVNFDGSFVFAEDMN